MPFRVDAIAGFRIGSRDPEATAAFLAEALGCIRHGVGPDGLRLALGAQALTVGEAEPGADDPALPANAPGFQHLALVVSDIAAAHARVLGRGAVAITRGGPRRLPPSSGGVTAWKFRTPQGQPLELLETPTDAWRRAAAGSDALFLGVDHTALGCSDLAPALAFYEALGFTRGAPSHNVGPEQDDLDGLDGVDLRIATLFTAAPGPHMELLHYVAPAGAAARTRSDVAVVLAGAGTAGRLDAPDGHLLLADAAQ